MKSSGEKSLDVLAVRDIKVTQTKSYCKCKEGYQPIVQPDYILCVQAPVRSTSPLYPTSLASLCILLLLLAFLLCFIFKLFSKTRWQQRPCADAALTPIIKLDGKDLVVTEEDDVISTSSPNSESRTYSPGPVLTPDELRKMSLLSSLSVTIPLDQDFDVRAVSPTGCHLSPEHIIPQVSSLAPPPPNIEHSVTIIPNLRAAARRRKSMADYAFPELHPETAQLQAPSKNLLIYTQTGVDPATGRRHSVSIPLLPPSRSRADTKAPLVTIQRKGSHHGPRTSRNMESIDESSVKMAASQETNMDCLTVPGLPVQQRRGQTGQRRREMSPRQNSLPARPSRRSSPSSGSRSHGSLRSSSFRRPDKQDFYQFLDSAIAH